MSNILYNIIHERSLAKWPKSIRLTAENYTVWEQLWFNTAFSLGEEFERSGLLETAKAIENIILEQRKFLPKKKEEPVPVEKKEPEPAPKSETGFENENILPDDYPIYGNYLYVCDGKSYRSIWNNITVARLKQLEKFKEVRRCNTVARKKAFLEGK